eukprot:438840_1
MSNCLREIELLLTIFTKPSINKLFQWVKGCYSKYPLESMRNIRTLLSMPYHPPIQIIVDLNIIPQIVSLLQANNYNFKMLFSGFIREMTFDYVIPDDIISFIDKICVMYCIDDTLQEEGRWILTNIACGNTQQTQYIVDNNAIPLLIDGLKSNTSIAVKDNSLQALGNICGNNILCRDLVLNNDILLYIPKLFTIKQLFEPISWILSNLCRNKPIPKLS